LQRWWIGKSPAPAGWRAVDPDILSGALPDFLAAGVIALDNVPVDALTRLAHERLLSYVRDLGGGLLILGGDRAFAAGHYAGSHLEFLSPLSSTPPTPASHWVLLADSSGSMSASIGDNSRWAFAINAMVRVIPLLPANDSLSAGNFSRNIRWWCRGQPVSEVAPRGLGIVPNDVRPQGPTNLEPALRMLAQSADGSTPIQALIITDADATIESAAPLGELLAAKKVRVNVVSTGPVAQSNPLQTIVKRTGGTIAPQPDPRHWAMELRSLMRSGSPRWLETSALAATFTPAGPPILPLRVTPWNRTWLRRGATELASGMAKDERVPAAAAWNIGTGAVIAAAFEPSADVTNALADRVIVPPRDPRFTITWDVAQPLRVRLDAIDNGRFINDLHPRLDLWADPSQPLATHLLAQIAPGRYELTLPAPSRQSIAKLTLDGRPLDVAAIAARYPQEFEAIGNNRSNAARLAESSGGEVIEPQRITPIEFHHVPRDISLSRLAAAAGAVLIAAAIIRWRVK
jgi:hypothetical protein